MNLPKLIVIFAALISSIIIVIVITGAMTFSFNQSSVSGQCVYRKSLNAPDRLQDGIG
jgi:hypothetical protein